MVYKVGDLVEVIGHEEGLFGSYYEAEIVEKLNPNEYVVTYKELLTEDLSGNLREVITVENLRPQPPQTAMENIYKGLQVDVFSNDGWWVGKITKETEGLYYVYFESTEEELPYAEGEMRVHSEWIDGNWISSNEN